ncbi:MotA/TolQ/ExbB proton channel family protein [Neisseria sp. Ec49-e6-T10]|uniref:MotA/TolQ/ExbB proton channel family protein n=1 Tax=Neisseria sp. Ec49-e6-T10 TaxID=3140744 RepID=UPI003EBE1874
MDVLSIIEEAGWTIWVLIASSVVSLAIIFERFWALRKSATTPRNLTETFEQAVADGQTDSLKNQIDSCLGRILLTLVNSKSQSKEDLEEDIQNIERAELAYLERFLTTLGSIAAMAPLMGLLGTVIGMIEIFASQSPSGSDPQMLARGISVALYNTAMGLVVAIPSMLFYRHFRAKVEAILMDIEVSASHFAYVLSKHRNTKK